MDEIDLEMEFDAEPIGLEEFEERARKGIRKCVAYKTVMSRKLGKPVRRCAKFQPLR